MRYQNFLLENSYDGIGRSVSISNEKGINLLTKKCKKSLNAIINIEPTVVMYDKGTIIYRGIPKKDEDFLSINPKQGNPRRSANTSNYYTLIIDNDPAWKEYPKRSQSIICSTGNDSATSYGTVYMVFPYDGAKIGVTPADDFWSGFANSKIYLMSNFNRSLQKLFKYLNISFDDDSWQDIQSAFKELDEEIDGDDDYYYDILSLSKASESWLKEYISFFNMEKFIRYKLNPKRNGFKLVHAGDQINCRDCEVWTDSQSILVKNTNDNRELIRNLKETI